MGYIFINNSLKKHIKLISRFSKSLSRRLFFSTRHKRNLEIFEDAHFELPTAVSLSTHCDLLCYCDLIRRYLKPFVAFV